MTGIPMSGVIVYAARAILTMDRNRPRASHVAVRDGRVLAVGGAEVLDLWGKADLDERFADKVLMPGFVEGHAHVLAGGMWRYVYIGDQDRVAPDGTRWPGAPDIETVITRLREAEAELGDASKPLIAWGFDPIFLTTERLNRHHLDQVSATRPIAVVHSNFHLITANSKVLEMAGFGAGSNVTGVLMDADGTPNGELQEMAAMFPVMRRLGIDFGALMRNPDGVRAYGEVARRCGVTTVTDLINDLTEPDVAQYLAITAEADWPVRLVPVLSAHAGKPADIARRALELKAMSTETLRLGSVKIVTDGSIQGFTARVRWPFYFKGPNHGIWNIAPEQLGEAVEVFHREGVHMHIHINGDEASEVTLEALAGALSRHPRGDHRHTLQHGQMMDEAQLRRAAVLGLSVNLFANHIWFFGDKHYEVTLGPDRAERIDACRSALDCGLNLAIHSDAPVTPMGPLFTAWCAVNRLTPSGRVLGAAQRIAVPEALRAITLGAAHTLRMDHEVGSIATGKRADFAVLDDDPQAVAPQALKDVGVVGTVLAGQPTAGA